MFGFDTPCTPVDEGQRTQTDPDTEGIERTGIRIVSFTRLVRRLVEVDDDRETGKEEEEEGEREALSSYCFSIFIHTQELPQDTDETQEQR